MKTLLQIESKIKRLYKQRGTNWIPKGGFILSNGMLFATSQHAAFMKSVDCTLKQSIKLGVCRFFSRCSTGGNVAAFEYKGELTTQQKSTIKKILKAENFFTVITEKETFTRFRPIRTIKF